jgi:hypothetical protein
MLIYRMLIVIQHEVQSQVAYIEETQWADDIYIFASAFKAD